MRRRERDRALVAFFLEGLRGKNDEAGFVPRVVLDVFLDDLQAVKLRGQPPGDDGGSLRLFSRQPSGRSRRVIIRLCFELVPREKRPALSQGLRMGIDRPDLMIIHFRRSEQTVVDGKKDFVKWMKLLSRYHLWMELYLPLHAVVNQGCQAIG